MDKKYLPLVSIVTTVKNCSQYIEQCIQSVLSQDYPYMEHILIDDSSSDGTLDIIKKYNKLYPDKIIFTSEPDSGACEAWNKGLKLSRGDILGWLGADDMYAPGAIPTVVTYFNCNKEAYFLFGKCIIIDENGNHIVTVGSKDFYLKKVLERCSNPIPATSAFYKREIISTSGYLDEKYDICDFEYWIRIAQSYEIYRIDNVLSFFRLHSGGKTGTLGSYLMRAKEKYSIVKQYRINNRLPSAGCLASFVAAFIMDCLRKITGTNGRHYKLFYKIKNMF